jgi:hypothetical protein
MKTLAFLTAAMLVAAPAFSEEVPYVHLVPGSNHCYVDPSECVASADPKPISWFSRQGELSIEELQELNELLVIQEGTMIPPNTFVRNG